MLAVGTVPWLRQKLRRPGATDTERSLSLMAASRSILLGVGILALRFAGQREALAGLLAGDGALQLFDVFHALALRKRSVAILPAILGLLDAGASFVLLTQP
jgi:hypothetical protein